MKKLLLYLLLAMLGNSAKSQSNDKEPFITTSLTKEGIKKVNARTSGGNLSVTGITTGEPRVEVYVIPSNNKEQLSKQEIQQRLEQDYLLTVTVTDDELSLIAKQNDRNLNWKRSLSISFKIFVQPNVSTDLHTSGGSINLSNLSGNQDFATSGGSLKLDKLKGQITGRTSGGSINVSNSSENINLKTSGGSINAKDCRGDIKLSTSGGSLNLGSLEGTIDASTSGGSINCQNISGGLKAHTSGGSVNLREMACSLDASTSGGSMNVDMVKLGAGLKLSNSGGNINISIPANQKLTLKLDANRITTGTLNNFSGSKEDDEVRGTLNGGGIPVVVNAGNGRITLNFK